VLSEQDSDKLICTLTSSCLSRSIRGYACGHQRCLTNDSTTGVQFITSKELTDHIRTDHTADEFPDHKPYRCGLPGCNKSWKVGRPYPPVLNFLIVLERQRSTISFTSVRPIRSVDSLVKTKRFLIVRRHISCKLSLHSPRQFLPPLKSLHRALLGSRKGRRRPTHVLMQTAHRYTNNLAV
jgi:hypothetical protein